MSGRTALARWSRATGVLPPLRGRRTARVVVAVTGGPRRRILAVAGCGTRFRGQASRRVGVSSPTRCHGRVRRAGREVRAAQVPIPPGFCGGHLGGGRPSCSRPFLARPHWAAPRVRRRCTRGGVAEADIIGPGTLTFDHAAVHEIDSSWEMCRPLAIGVVRLLGLPADGGIPMDLLPRFGGSAPESPGAD